MSKPKTHLCNSDEPLKEGETLLAICGQEVPRSRFVFRWDDYETFAGIPVTNFSCLLASSTALAIGMCRNCREHDLTKRYIYGVRTREDIQEEAE